MYRCKNCIHFRKVKGINKETYLGYCKLARVDDELFDENEIACQQYEEIYFNTKYEN